MLIKNISQKNNFNNRIKIIFLKNLNKLKNGKH